jgi:hypothetical protein
VYPDRQEYVCPTCGEVLYEGPDFTEGRFPQPKEYNFPPMSVMQVGELRRAVGKAMARANL